MVESITKDPKAAAPKPVDPNNPVGNPGPLPPIQTKFDPRLTPPPRVERKSAKIGGG
jgi:hypothetical protein